MNIDFKKDCNHQFSATGCPQVDKVYFSGCTRACLPGQSYPAVPKPEFPGKTLRLFPAAAKDFSSVVNFQRGLSIPCINIVCALKASNIGSRANVWTH